MPTQTENRARLADAAQAYIDAYLAKYELGKNPANDSQNEWEADTDPVWYMENLRIDAQDAQSLISEVDTRIQSYQAILDTNDVIIRDAFKDNTVKEKIQSQTFGWAINYNDIDDEIFVTGLIPYSPPEVSDLFLWYRPESIIDDGSGNVATWNDDSGNGYNLTSIATNPFFDTTLQAVTFTGTERLQSATIPFSVTQAITILAVMQNDAASAAIFLESSPDFNTSDAFILISNGYVDGDLVVGSKGNVGIDREYIVTVKNTPILVDADIYRAIGMNDCTLYINESNAGAVHADSAINTSAFGDNKLNLGARQGGGAPFYGLCMEILVYKRKLGSGEKASLNTYLINKYSL